MRTGIANLPLHGGKAPAWLFSRMTKLAREIIILYISEFNSISFIEKISDPFWFQALGCVLGFDWHSSGVTTTVCGAIKEAVKGLELDLNLFIKGGKGATSRKTPSEIENSAKFIKADPKNLIYASRMSAKVDSSCIQDGFQIYAHTFLYTKEGLWATVQQGMNEQTSYARRYHWLGKNVEDFVTEPHSAICCDSKKDCLNMVAKESEKAKEQSAIISREKPEKIITELGNISKLKLPRHHEIRISEINPKNLHKILTKTYEEKPVDFENLVATPGVGPKTIRSLALVSELIYGAKPSFADPARFSFAHGGKDGHPYPVDKENYDRSIYVLREILNKAKVDRTEKVKAFKRLARF